MDELTIAEQVLVDALRSAQQGSDEDNPEGALTTMRLHEITGWGVETVRRTLRVLNKKGLLTRAKVHVTDLAGRRMPVVAYRIGTGPLKAMIAQLEEGDSEENDGER